MNSKERVLAALSHKTADRVPITRCHGFWILETEQALLQYFNLKGPDTLDAIFNFDVYWVEAIYRGPPLGADADGNQLGIWGTPDSTNTYTQEFIRPLAEATGIADIEAYPWPKIEWLDFSTIRHFADLYRDYAIATPRTWSPLFCRIADLRGFERSLMDLVTAPKIVEAIVEKVTDYNCAYYQNLLDAAPGQIDVAYIGDDPAGQLGMLMSPDHWRRYFKPALARLFDVVRSRGVHVMYHICGSFRPIIPDLIDIGADILMPLQFSAADMDPAELKREFGTEVSFWGGVDTQYVLPHGTPEEVRAEARRLIDILGQDGGYVLSSSHNLMGDVPPENIVAMYDEAARYYPFWEPGR